jgi:hypothetical protein
MTRTHSPLINLLLIHMEYYSIKASGTKMWWARRVINSLRQCTVYSEKNLDDLDKKSKYS